jgi:hypothetical protein
MNADGFHGKLGSSFWVAFLTLGTCPTSTKKHSSSYEVAEVIPSARIGESIDPNVCKKTTNKTEVDEEAMQYA